MRTVRLLAAPVLVTATLGASSLFGSLEVVTANPSITSPTRGDVLISQHHCWTGEAPADQQGKLPGHTIVTLPSGRTVYGGRHLVSQSMQQLFNHAQNHLTIHAFCR